MNAARGQPLACPAQCSSDVYDAAAATVTPAGLLSVARSFHTATRLDDGTVLVVGGNSIGGDTATAELFDPSTNALVAAGAMAGTRSGHTATLLQDGSVLLVGGFGPFAANVAELYLTNAIAPISLTVTPSSATLQTGASRAFNAVDHLSHSRTDALRSVTNASIATVDSDTGVVTAVAAGSVTVTATIGAVRGVAQIAVTRASVEPIDTVGHIGSYSVPGACGSNQEVKASKMKAI